MSSNGGNGLNQGTSSNDSQLLFFDSLTSGPLQNDELPTECIRFHQRVVLSEIRIVPKNFRPFIGTRKSDYSGQTSPSKFDLHFLIHKTLTSDVAKSPKKALPNLPLHPLTISFDETKGYQSFDVTLSPEATTRFIILRGNYQAVTLCIYGRVMESNKIQNPKNKETNGGVLESSILPQKAGHIKENKEENRLSINVNNGSNDIPELEQQNSELNKGNIKDKITNSGSPQLKQSSSFEAMHNPSIHINFPGSHTREKTIEVAQNERTISLIENSSTKDLFGMTTPLTQDIFVTPMEEDSSFIDDGMKDIISDEDRIGILFRKDRTGAFKILSPLVLPRWLVCTNDETYIHGVLLRHSSPDETAISLARNSFSETPCRKAWDQFSRIAREVGDILFKTPEYPNSDDINIGFKDTESTASNLSALIREANDVIIEAVIWAQHHNVQYQGKNGNFIKMDKLNCLIDSVPFALDIISGKSSLKLFENGVALLSKLSTCGEILTNTQWIENSLKPLSLILNQDYTSTYLQTKILEGLLKCMDDPIVIERILGWNQDESITNSIFQSSILPMLQRPNLTSRVMHLVQANVRKVSLYEACALIQKAAEEEAQQEIMRRKRKTSKKGSNNLRELHSSEVYHDSVPEDYMAVDRDNHIAIQQIIKRVVRSLHIISRAALYHMALNPNEANCDKSTSFCFRYLTSSRLFSSITILFSSHRLRSSNRFCDLVNSVGRLCVTLLAAPSGMCYLAKQLQPQPGSSGEHLLALWASLLCQANEHTTIQMEEESDSIKVTPEAVLHRWADATEIRQTIGIADILCGLGRSLNGGIYDEDYDYIHEYPEDQPQSENEDPNLRKARRILNMHSYGAIGANIDYLDHFSISSDQLIILLAYQLYAIATVERLVDLGSQNFVDDCWEDCEKIISLMNDLFEMTVFPVGKQAVASTIIYLDALPIILSCININPVESHADDSISSYGSNLFGRLPFELLEVVLKFSKALPHLLTANVNELISSFVAMDNNLRALWDPVAVYHESGGIQAVIDLIKQQKFYPECLRDHTVVNQTIVAMRLLMTYTYTEEGMVQILKSRMDDFSGLDNGDSLLVFLLRLLNYIAEVLSDLSDFAVYTEQPSTELSSGGIIDVITSGIMDPIKGQDISSRNVLFSSTELTKAEHENLQLTPLISSSNVILSSEIFELRKELLELVWCNLMLIRRLLLIVYGDRENSAAKRHFTNIFKKDETPDDPLPSQEKSMIRAFVEPFLMLISALDHIDGRLSDQLGSVSLLIAEQQFKSGQTLQIARVRGLVSAVFGLLTQVNIVDDNDSNSGEIVKELRCHPRFFSVFAGRHVIKHLCDFIFEGPDNILSGLYMISEILPVPLFSRALTSTLQDHIFAENTNHDVDKNQIALKRSIIQRDGQLLRDYWVKQLLPLRDELMQITKRLAPVSSKIIHIVLRNVVCQMVNLDIHDGGLAKGIVAVVVNGVREAAHQYKTVFEARNTTLLNNSAANDNSNEDIARQNDRNSLDVETEHSIFGRWISLLTCLAENSAGRTLLLDMLRAKVDDPMMFNNSPEEISSDESIGLVSLLLEFVRTNQSMDLISDLIMEFILSLCNHTISSEKNSMPDVKELSVIVESMLELVKHGKEGRLQVEALLILQKITETEIGALLILSKTHHRLLISNMLAWVPELLRSQDLGMQELHIAYHSILLIQKVIDYPSWSCDSFNSPLEGDQNVKPLAVLIDSTEDPEALWKTYENIEQHVLELPYEPSHVDEEVYDVETCQLLAGVIRQLKEALHFYIREVKDHSHKLNPREILKEFGKRFAELTKSLNSREKMISQNVDSRSHVATIIVLPSTHPNKGDISNIPFYDVVDDLEGKEGDGGLFNVPDIEIDFEIFAKEMLPNFQFHKKMKMTGDSAAKGRKLLKARTLTKLGGIAYESNARRNLGGGKTYQKNEFRSIHNNRKANTSRPPSVHVDDFMSGKIPVNQQHPDMVTTSSTTTTPVLSSVPSLPQKKLNTPNRLPAQSKRSVITTATPIPQTGPSPRGGRGRRPSTSSASTTRGGTTRIANSSGRGLNIGRGTNSNPPMVNPWETWTAPPTLPILMPPISKYMEFERRMEGQRDYPPRYDSQPIRAGYYDNPYYGIPSPIPPYDRPPVQQSGPSIGPRIKSGSETRGRTISQEWPQRSLASQPIRRPERPFGRR
ncbi:hypothetical protein G9A89_020402 [Geosiphon pyriformis]|nr:hypothetical protein G9A89_020402 [Geosiphon pyriformis]